MVIIKYVRHNNSSGFYLLKDKLVALYEVFWLSRSAAQLPVCLARDVTSNVLEIWQLYNISINSFVKTLIDVDIFVSSRCLHALMKDFNTWLKSTTKLEVYDVKFHKIQRGFETLMIRLAVVCYFVRVNLLLWICV